MLRSFSERLSHAWNAFKEREDFNYKFDMGPTHSHSSFKPSHVGYANRSIINTIYNRIALDVVETPIRHVRVSQNEIFEERITSGLDECLTWEANVDQTGRSLIQDLVLTLFDDGVAAVVPVDTTLNPKLSGSWDVKSLQVARVQTWYADRVKVKVYDDQAGIDKEIIVNKDMTAIIYNPFYEVMNKDNSTLKRLINTLNLIDMASADAASGKLDLIFQLPYVVKTEEKKRQAEIRRKSIEDQLANGRYGIAYTDGTERITQLNRPANNNLLDQVRFLTSELYTRLGITEEILNGSADEAVMSNYFSRTVKPIVTAISEEMTRKFLTKTARTQGQRIQALPQPLRFASLTSMTNALDTFLRHEVMTSNEARGFLGMPPSSEPTADELRNANINPVGSMPAPPQPTPAEEPSTEE